MVKTLNLTTKIASNREIRITLPDDVPIGPAELFLIIKPQSGSSVRTLGDLLHSEFFGMWRDRTDIQDSVAYAQQLRQTAWNRD